MALSKADRAALRELEFELTKPHTLEEIADFLGVSIPYVHEIEKRALFKMKETLLDEGKEDWEGPLVDPEEPSSPFGT